MGTAASVDFLLLSAIWGASFMFIDMAALEFGPVPTAALRVGIAALMLLPLLLRRGLGRELLRQWKPLLGVGLLNSGIPFALLGWQRGAPDAGNAAASHQALLAIAACMLACLCYGIAASCTKRYLTGLPALLTAGGSQIGAAAGLARPALLTWPAELPGLRAWLAVLTLGVMCTAFAYLLFFRLIEKAGPSRTLTVTFVVPVFAVVYGMLFLGEQVSASMALCAVLIVCGTALSTGLVALQRRPRCPSPT